MNKFPVTVFAEYYMKKAEMGQPTDKYLFIVSNSALCIAIISHQYRAICLESDEDVNQFVEYMDKIRDCGTQRTDYVYVLALEKKKHNDRLAEYMKSDPLLKYHEGWQLFKNKEYLSNSHYGEELVEVINSLVKRYEPAEASLMLDQFHHMKEGKSGETGAVGAFDSEIRKHLLQHNNLFICGHPYIYKDGVYVEDPSGTRLKAIIEQYLYPKYQKSNVISQIYNLIIATDSIQRSFGSLNLYPETYINFMDCMLDVATMTEVPHSPKYFAINQIPFKWQDIKNATKGTEVEKFLEFIMRTGDDRAMLLQYVGLILTRDTRQQRFLTLCGLGGTGKSVLIRLIEAAVGPGNISNVSLQELSKRFSTSLLVGKLLNSCADLSAEMLEDSSVMKKLLGEDNIFAERKGEQGFMYRNYSKLLFSTNSLPIIAGERTNGFYRRLMILKMDRQPEKVDTELFSKLSAELPYFIRLAVQALHEMYINGGVITISKSSQEAVEQMWKDSDVVQAWLDDCCTLDPDAKTDRTKAFESFKKYCEREDRQAMTKNGFYKALRNKNFAENLVHGYRYIKGVSLEKNCTQSTLESTPDGFFEVPEWVLGTSPFPQKQRKGAS